MTVSVFLGGDKLLGSGLVVRGVEGREPVTGFIRLAVGPDLGGIPDLAVLPLFIDKMKTALWRGRIFQPHGDNISRGLAARQGDEDLVTGGFESKLGAVRLERDLFETHARGVELEGVEAVGKGRELNGRVAEDLLVFAVEAEADDVVPDVVGLSAGKIQRRGLR